MHMKRKQKNRNINDKKVGDKQKQQDA